MKKYSAFFFFLLLFFFEVYTTGCEKQESKTITSVDSISAALELNYVATNMADLDDMLADPIVGIPTDNNGGIPKSTAIVFSNPNLIIPTSALYGVRKTDSSTGKYIDTITYVNDTLRFGVVYTGRVLRTFVSKKKIAALTTDDNDSVAAVIEYQTLRTNQLLTTGIRKIKIKRSFSGYVITNTDSVICRRNGSDTTRMLKSVRVATQTQGISTTRNLRDDRYQIDVQNYSELQVRGILLQAWISESKGSNKIIRALSCPFPIGGQIDVYKSNAVSKDKQGDIDFSIDFSTNANCSNRCLLKQTGKNDKELAINAP